MLRPGRLLCCSDRQGIERARPSARLRAQRIDQQERAVNKAVDEMPAEQPATSIYLRRGDDEGPSRVWTIGTVEVLRESRSLTSTATIRRRRGFTHALVLGRGAVKVYSTAIPKLEQEGGTRSVATVPRDRPLRRLQGDLEYESNHPVGDRRRDKVACPRRP